MRNSAYLTASSLTNKIMTSRVIHIRRSWQSIARALPNHTMNPLQETAEDTTIIEEDTTTKQSIAQEEEGVTLPKKLSLQVEKKKEIVNVCKNYLFLLFNIYISPAYYSFIAQ